MKRFVLFVCLIISIPLSLSALTVEQGRVRLVLHEESGRFSIYYLENIEKNRYTSLFFERDPRTSATGLLLDNRIVTLGAAKSFEQKAEKTVDGARFTWVSSRIKVDQDFSFVKSDPTGLADGIIISITVTNISEEIQSAGVHLLFDTYLGENDDAHFVTSANEKISGETGYTLKMPVYWMSEVQNKNFRGVQSVIKGTGITLPDRIVFSNWKRLSENLWNLQIQSNRNFNLLPYSINDSAVCQFYDPIRLASGASRKIVALIGAYTSNQFSLDSVSTASDDALDQVLVDTSSIATGDLEELVQQDLIAVNDLISNIDSLLSFPNDISEEKIEIIRRAVQNLRIKKEQYQSSQ